MAILESIASRGYRATEAQVEQLAKHVSMGRRADGTYLRVLVVAVQSKRPRTKARALAVLDQLHERFYKAVQRGVGPSTLKASERRRRSAFARSTASTLRGFIRSGGAIAKVDVATISKVQLRRFGQPKPRGNRNDRIVATARRSLFNAVRRTARKSPQHAKDMLLALISKANAELRALPDFTPVRVVEPKVAHTNGHATAG